MVAKKNGKPDLNEASREELVEVAGLKPATAQTIVKLRDEKGPIGSVEQLRDVAKLGKAEIDKLQGSFVVAAKAARETVQETARQGGETSKKAADAGQDMARHGAEAGRRAGETAQTAVRQGNETVKKVAETGQDMARRGTEAARRTSEEAVRQGGETVRKVAEATRDMGQRGAEAGQRMAETVQKTTQDALGQMAEASRAGEGVAPLARIGIMWMSFWPEQAAQGVATAGRLMQCRSLPEMIQVQSEFAMGSLDRLARRFTSTTEMVANQADRARKAA